MKKVFILMFAVVFLICLGTGAFAAEPKKVVKESITTATAIVQAIDLQNRVVTLKDKDGNIFDLKVDKRAKNLPQVKVGDQLTVQYYESIAVQLAKPGASPKMSETQVAESAKAGKKPAGVRANIVNVIATIVDIDPKKTYITLKGPEGRYMNMKVNDPKNLDNVKVGDALEITYTEALAVKVAVVKEPKKK